MASSLTDPQMSAWNRAWIASSATRMALVGARATFAANAPAALHRTATEDDKQGIDRLRVDLTVSAVNLLRHARGPLVDAACHLTVQRLTMEGVAQHSRLIGLFLEVSAARLRFGAHAFIFAFLDRGSMLAVPIRQAGTGRLRHDQPHADIKEIHLRESESR